MLTPPVSDDVDLGDHYARSRERLCALLHEAGEEAAGVPVPACPGWTVHDVVAHLLGNIEDGAAGRIQGIPTEAQTGEPEPSPGRGPRLVAPPRAPPGPPLRVRPVAPAHRRARVT